MILETKDHMSAYYFGLRYSIYFRQLVSQQVIVQVNPHCHPEEGTEPDLQLPQVRNIDGCLSDFTVHSPHRIASMHIFFSALGYTGNLPG